MRSALTWAKTKPASKDEPELPLNEEEYRRRRAHPECKPFQQVERAVMKAQKDEELLTFVVCSGVMYGEGEDTLHFLFKEAWHGNDVPCVGDGKNIVPTIHVNDAARIALSIADLKPENRYTLAVDAGLSSLYEMCESISTKLGNGKVKLIPPNDALTFPDIEIHNLQMLQLNIRMEATTAHNLDIEWRCPDGLQSAQGIATAIEEYRAVRRINPLRLAVLGPPASGKSFVTEKLAEKYGLHIVDIPGAISQVLAKKGELAEDVAVALRGGEGSSEVGDDERDRDRRDRDRERERGRKGDSQVSAAADLLNVPVPNTQSAPSPRLTDSLLIKVIRDVLSSNKCQNQGYILDGFPKTAVQAANLFGSEEVEDEDVEEDEGDLDASSGSGNALLPEFVVNLEASDRFLIERVMAIPDNVGVGVSEKDSSNQAKQSQNTEEAFTHRLKLYRQRNAVDLDHTALSWLEDHSVFPITIDVEQAAADDDDDNEALFSKVFEPIGEPRNYGPSKEVLLERAKKEAMEKERKEKEDQKVLEMTTKREEEEREKRIEDAARAAADILAQDKERLESASLPLRGYLMDSVVPVLTEALVRVCRVRPEDPIDFIAEYLFRNNPASEDPQS